MHTFVHQYELCIIIVAYIGAYCDRTKSPFGNDSGKSEPIGRDSFRETSGHVAPSLQILGAPLPLVDTI